MRCRSVFSALLDLQWVCDALLSSLSLFYKEKVHVVNFGGFMGR